MNQNKSDNTEPNPEENSDTEINKNVGSSKNSIRDSVLPKATHEIAKSSNQNVMSGKKILTIIAIGSILAGGAAAGYVFGIDPAIKKSQASQELLTIAENRGPITAKNTELLDFTKPNSSEDMVGQKALGSSGQQTESAAFVFTNGKNNASKTVDLYLDFGSQRSRDFIVLNNHLLRGMIENGSIDLNIHPVPGSEPFSIYGPEALAETFVWSPEKAWPFLLELMKISATLDDSPTGDNPEEILTSISNSVVTIGINGVTSETISSGSFANWILTVGDDSRVKNEFGLPALYVDGGLVDQNTVDINDPESLKKFLRD